MTKKILKSMIVMMAALFSTTLIASPFNDPKAPDSDLLIIQVNKFPTFTIEVDSTQNTNAKVSSSNFFKFLCADEVTLDTDCTVEITFIKGTEFKGTWKFEKGTYKKNSKVDGTITLPKEVSATHSEWYKGEKVGLYGGVSVRVVTGLQKFTSIALSQATFDYVKMSVSKSTFAKTIAVKEQDVFFKTKNIVTFVAVPKADKKITAELCLNEVASKDATFDITTDGSTECIVITDSTITISKGKKSAKVNFTIISDSVEKLDLFNKKVGFNVIATVIKADSDIFNPAALKNDKISYEFKDEQSKYIKATMKATGANGEIDVNTPMHGSDTLLLSFDFNTTKPAILLRDSIMKDLNFRMHVKVNGPVKTLDELKEVFEADETIYDDFKDNTFSFETEPTDTTLMLTVKDPSKMGKYSFTLVAGTTVKSNVKFKASGKTAITIEPIKEVQVATNSENDETIINFTDAGKTDIYADLIGDIEYKMTVPNVDLKSEAKKSGLATVVTDKKVLKGYIGKGVTEGNKTIVEAKAFNLEQFTKAPAFFAMSFDPIKDKLEYKKAKKYAFKTTFEKTSDTAVTTIIGKGPKAYNPSVLAKARKAGYSFTDIVDSEGVSPSAKNASKATEKEIVYNFGQLVGAPYYLAIKEGKADKANNLVLSEKDALKEAPIGVYVFATPTIDTVQIADTVICNGAYVKGGTDTAIVTLTESDDPIMTIEGSNFIGSKAKIVIEFKSGDGAVIAKSINVDKSSTDKKLIITFPSTDINLDDDDEVRIIIDNGSTLTPIKAKIVGE